jgi:TolB-like protein
MTTRTGFLAAFVLVVSWAAWSQTQKLTVAVSDLLPQGLDNSSANIITDRLRNELFNSGNFTVLERGQMEQVLKEQGFQQSGCTSDACAVEIGQLLGVQYLIVGSIGKIGQTYTINVRLIDVTSGKITQTANTDCKCEIDQVLSVSTADIARRLSKSIAGGAPEPQAPAVAAPAPPPADTVKKPVPAAAKPAPAVAAKKKHAMWPKLVLGVAALGSGVAGYLMNTLVETNIREGSRIQDEYRTSGSNLNYDRYSSDHKAQLQTAQSRATTRNILYGVAGVAVVGFGLSFAF